MNLGLSLTDNLRLGRPAFTPADLFAASELGAWYDPSDLSTLWQDTAATTPVTADGQAVARIDDKSGNGNNLTQATGTKCPLYKTDGTYHWILFDGVDDGFALSPLNGLGTGGNCLFGMQTTDTQWLTLHNGGGLFMSAAQNGSVDAPDANLGTPSYSVSRTALAANTRDALHDAMSSASSRVLSVTDIDYTLFTEALAFDYNSYQFGGKLYGLIIHEGLTAQQVAKAEGWLAQRAGATL